MIRKIESVEVLALVTKSKQETGRNRANSFSNEQNFLLLLLFNVSSVMAMLIAQ